MSRSLISNVGVCSHLTSASFLPPPFSLRNRDKDLVSFLGSVEWFFRLNEGYLQLHRHLTGKWPVERALQNPRHFRRLCLIWAPPSILWKVVQTLVLLSRQKCFSPRIRSTYTNNLLRETELDTRFHGAAPFPPPPRSSLRCSGVVSDGRRGRVPLLGVINLLSDAL